MFNSYRIRSIDEINTVPFNRLASVVDTNIYAMRAKNHPSPSISDGFIYFLTDNTINPHIIAHALFDRIKDENGNVKTVLKTIDAHPDCNGGRQYIMELLEYMIEHDNLTEFDLPEGIDLLELLDTK